MNERKPSFYLQEAAALAQELERLPAAAPQCSTLADEVLCIAEQGALAARRTYAEWLVKPVRSKRASFRPQAADITGTVQSTAQGWIRIRMETLLQSNRRQTTGYLENTILRLLQQYRAAGNALPWYPHALIAITEHVSRKGGNVYDPDNKEWKCITNALKGVLFEDDDQLTISLLLDSVCDGKRFTEITVLPYADAGRYFAVHKAR